MHYFSLLRPTRARVFQHVANTGFEVLKGRILHTLQSTHIAKSLTKILETKLCLPLESLTDSRHGRF